MNKSIKRLIEEYIVSFNPAIIANNTPKSKIDTQTVSNVVGVCPEDTNTLREVVLERVRQNPKKPYLLNIDTSKIKSMFELFNGNGNMIYGNNIFQEIEELDLSTWDTSNVTDMAGMFRMCSKLNKINISNFNTSNVTDMSSMFDGCRNLTSLDLSNFNTEKVTNMHDMFFDCYNLQSLNISSFNTENVTQIYNMFYHCASLEDVDFSNFSLKSVTAKWNILAKVSRKIQNKFKRQTGLKKL